MDLESRILVVLAAADVGQGIKASALSKLMLLVGFGRHWDDLGLRRSALGPTSVAVWDAIERMQHDGLVATAGGECRDWHRRIRLTELGEDRLKEVALSAPAELYAIGRVVEGIDRDLLEEDLRILATAASVVYPSTASYFVRDAEAVESASRRQGWRVSEGVLEKATQLVGNVRVAAQLGH